MARTYPEEPHPNTDSQAELQLFKIFKEGLSHDYVVFHSIAWQVRDTHGGIKDGETDFIIVNPRLDLLVIEVKGGGIRYEGNTRKWFSTDRFGIEHSIEDPVFQAKKAQYSLLAKLKEVPQWKNKWLNIGRGVAFPNIRIYDDLFLDTPRELILDLSDTQEDISTWVERAFAYLQQDEGYREVVYHNHEDINSLVQLLSPSWEFHFERSREIETQENIITRLTNDQFTIIDFLLRHRRVAIAGCAGSGKTLVAIEKASRLGQEGFRTLLLCHNPQLADFISSKINCDLVQIIDFFSWISQILDKEQVQYSNTQWSQFSEISEKDLENAFDKITASNKKYDAIIVDEGQDFRETWWLVVEAALKDENKSILYVFHDDNQALYLYGSQFKYPIQQAPYTLSKNCRNAGMIFELIQKLHPQAPEPSIKLAGKGIVKDFVCKRNNVFSTVSDAIREARKSIGLKYSLVLLTTEFGSPMQSVLNEQEISLTEQKELIPRWQEAVEKYTDIPLGTLSLNSYPNIDDIKKVTSLAQHNHYSRNRRNEYGGYHFGDEDMILRKMRWVRWGIEPNGRMFLRGLPNDRGGRYRPNYRQHFIWRFFADTQWANDIPKIHTKVKIISIDDQKLSSEDENHIPLHTVASFKGLEADGVILFYWGHYPTDDELLALNTLYVGLSRAKHLLYFISPIPLSKVLAKKDIYSPDPNLFTLNRLVAK